MDNLESILVSFFRNIYPFIAKLKVDKDSDGDDVEYTLTLFCDGKKFQSYLPISPNFIDGTGKLKKDLLDRELEYNKSSYWNKRESKPFDKDSYTKHPQADFFNFRLCGSK